MKLWSRVTRKLVATTGLTIALVVVPCIVAAQGENICRRGGGDDVHLVLQYRPETSRVVVSIDQAYWDHPPALGETHELRSALLHLRASDFSPWPRSVPRNASADSLLSLLIGNADRLEDVADRLGKLNLGFRVTDEVIWQDAPGPHGLIVLTAPPPQEPSPSIMIGDYDIYVARDSNGAVSDLIRCTRANEVRFPFCSHLVAGAPLSLELSYSVELLREWADISARARTFFDCIAAP